MSAYAEGLQNMLTFNRPIIEGGVVVCQTVWHTEPHGYYVIDRDELVYNLSYVHLSNEEGDVMVYKLYKCETYSDAINFIRDDYINYGMAI